MNYTDVTRIFDLLESRDGVITITPANISGFVSLSRSINPDGDLEFGAINTADISVELLDIKESAQLYMGKMFRYRKGYAGQRESFELDHPADLHAQARSYAVETRGNQLILLLYGERSVTLPAVPGGLVVKGDQVTVLYPTEPFVGKYRATSAGWKKLPSPVLGTYEKNTVLDLCRAHKTWTWLTEDTLDAVEVIGQTATYWRYEVHDMGWFTADRPRRGTGGQFTLTCHDSMELFDQDVKYIFQGVVSGSLSANTVLTRLSNYVEVPIEKQTRHNQDVMLAVPDKMETISGYQVLTWLGEIMGCSWRINTKGNLESVWFRDTPRLLTMEDYIGFDYEAFMVAKVGKVLSGSEYADVVGFAGTGANTLIISGNSLLPYETEEDLIAFSQGLLDIAGMVPEYRPGTLHGYADPTIAPGDILRVVTEESGKAGEPICVTQITETGFVLDITSSGNPKREVQNFGTFGNAALKKEVAELQQQVGSFPAKWEKAIADTVKEITGALGGTRVDLMKPGTAKPSGTAYLFDSEDIKTAQELLVINAGGIAFYEHGFDVAHPELSIPSFTVMDKKGHINAAAIMVGVLTAIRIQSADGKSFWDLATGDMSMTGTFITELRDRYRTVLNAAVLSLYDGDFLRSRLYTIARDPAKDSLGQLQVFSGNVTDEGPQDETSRYTFINPEEIGVGEKKDGSYSGKVTAGEVTAGEVIANEVMVGGMRLSRSAPEYGGSIQIKGANYYSGFTSDGIMIRKMKTPGEVGAEDDIIFDANYNGELKGKSLRTENMTVQGAGSTFTVVSPGSLSVRGTSGSATTVDGEMVNTPNLVTQKLNGADVDWVFSSELGKYVLASK